MRDIKFRLWCKSEKCMYYPDDFSLHGFVGRDGHFPMYAIYANGETGESDCLMQFTGLTDCNGVEIYENDVCKIKAGADLGPCFDLIGVVEFEEFEYAVTTTDHHWPCVSWKCVVRCEVIGNAYEHKHLLEEQKMKEKIYFYLRDPEMFWGTLNDSECEYLHGIAAGRLPPTVENVYSRQFPCIGRADVEFDINEDIIRDEILGQLEEEENEIRAKFEVEINRIMDKKQQLLSIEYKAV